jgi:hypothetical protein
LNYKRRLLSKLVESGWQVVSKDDGPEWWAEEQWTIRSVAENPGLELVVSFLIDQHSETGRRAKRVCGIAARREAELTYPNDQTSVACVHLVRGSFEARISSFVQQVNEYRRSEER